MAEIIIPDDFGNAVFQWTELGSGRLFSCTLGYGRLTSGSTVPGVHAQDFYTYLTTGSAPCAAAQMNPNWRFDGVKTYFRQGTDLFGGESTGSPVTGTHTGAAGDPLPNSVAIVVQKKTSILGKRHRGRFYMPTLRLTSEAVSTGGTINGTNLGVIQSTLDVFVDAVNDSADVYMALLHSEVLGPDTIINLQAAGQIGIQRRRTS